MHTTREGWLLEAVGEIKSRMFDPLNLELPKIVRVSPGFCGGTKAIGMCVKPECADDASTSMFVDPLLADPVEVLAVLIHELVHAHCFALGLDCGHKGKFVKIIRELGLEGKPTATIVVPGSALHQTCIAMAMKLGDYPHAPVRRKTKPRPKHNWISYISTVNEEYIVRANRNTVEEFGPPRDPQGEAMVPKDGEGGDDDGDSDPE